MNRTGTYVAFDGLGQKDPAKSDFKYYAVIKAWNENQNINFSITDSHEKTYSVRDTSMKRTLYSRIRQRLSASKNMLIILTQDTRYTGSVLSYEIEQAIDEYQIPLIIAYPGYRRILNVNELSSLWPRALRTRIDGNGIKAIHIAFIKEAVLDAISQFGVNKQNLQGGMNHYSQSAYEQWEY